MVRLAFLIMLIAAPADEAAVRIARTSQNAAIAAGDLDRVASFWTQGVTWARAQSAAERQGRSAQGARTGAGSRGASRLPAPDEGRRGQ